MQTANLREAAYAFAGLVERIPGDAWDGAGLGEWDLRSLVGHTSRALITIETYLQQPVDRVECVSAAAYYSAATNPAGSAAVAERGRQAGRDLGAEPVEAVRQLVARVLPLLDRDDDPIIHTAAGGMQLSTYLPTRTLELVVHGQDIAAAIGIDAATPSPALLNEALGVLIGAAVLRGLGPELLHGLTGRAPLPPDFSLV